jgi:hypothetical protein
MPSWITIVVADLNEARVAELITALREEALGVGQPDPMPGIITKVVDEVRSCIGFCTTTPLDTDATKVPANLKDMVVQKIIRTMKGRLLMPLTDDEKSEETTYQARLKLLTQCAWPVDKTDTPIAESSVAVPSSTPRITPRCISRQDHL